MPRIKRSRLSQSLKSTFAALLSIVLLLIAISHLATYAETGITAVLLFALAEIVIAVLFLLRVPGDVPAARAVRPPPRRERRFRLRRNGGVGIDGVGAGDVRDVFAVLNAKLARLLTSKNRYERSP